MPTLSTTIDAENAKQIRKSMEVYCGFSSLDTSATETLSELDQLPVFRDTNAANSLKQTGWNPVPLADLSGGGFALDGGAVFPVESHTASAASGKYGIQSMVGEVGEYGVTFQVRTNSNKGVSVTTKGSGRCTTEWGGQIRATFDITEQFTINCPAYTDVLVSISNLSATERVIVYTVVPGVSINFTNDNLISVTLDLAGNLSLTEPSLEVSSIELNAYYPDDISNALSALPDNVPLWYYAGYDGDFSETRNFYLSEPATIQNNVLTLRGTDMSGKLEERSIRSKVVATGKEYYDAVKSAITSAGITLKHYQGMSADTASRYYGVIEAQSVQELVGDMMVSFHAEELNFWCTYTDAGIPRLYNRMISASGTYRQPWQLRVWDIYEEDCADVVRNVERKVASISNEEDGEPIASLITKVDTGGVKIALAEKGTKPPYLQAGAIEYISAGQLFINPYLPNASRIIYQDSTGVKCVVKNRGLLRLYGVPLTEKPFLTTDYPSNAQPGIALRIKPAVRGSFNSAGGLVPKNYRRFFGSNVTGSFTFKGDPRMQPRDTFKFHRLDGTVEVATIERIELTHEGGGTTAELHYRLGVC